MEVLVGPTFTIDVSSSPAYVRDRGGAAATAQEKQAAVASCLFLKDDGVVGSGIGIRGKEKPRLDDESSDSTSSIGVPDDSDVEDDASSKGDGNSDEVQSKFSRGGGFGSLGSLSSLEETLPIKRGLSNHFSGKSKSFANLSEVSTVNNVKQVEKAENPFNKRRRVLIAAKWSRRSFYNWPNPKSMPLLALNEEDDDGEQEVPQFSSADKEQKRQQHEREDHDGDDDEHHEEETDGLAKLRETRTRRLNSFKSKSCFSLTDLQEHTQS